MWHIHCDDDVLICLLQDIAMWLATQSNWGINMPAPGNNSSISALLSWYMYARVSTAGTAFVCFDTPPRNLRLWLQSLRKRRNRLSLPPRISGRRKIQLHSEYKQSSAWWAYKLINHEAGLLKL